MTDQPPSPPSAADIPDELAEKPVFAPYNAPAGGWGALHATARALREQSVALKGSRALLSMNQPEGFDCPGCAWPDPRHTSSFEFCENGAKAVTWELTKRRVTRDFFAAHTVRQLEQESDYWLEEQGRLTEPMRYDPATDHYVPVDWAEAFALVGRELNALNDPNEAEFYTSGRTSNEAAFMYQLFIRRFGTNNFPDCSNMCHEPTSVGLPESIGIGKGTVLLIGAGGGVSGAAAQIARRLGARVIGVDRRAPHPDAPIHAIAEKLIIGVKDLPAEVRAATAGKGADVVFDLVGGVMFCSAVDSLALRGRLIEIAATGQREVSFDLADFYHNESRLVPSGVWLEFEDGVVSGC